MLKGIDPLLTPELLRLLAEMGHGDIIAVVDRNFPAHGSGRPVVELPGADVTAVLSAILTLMPVDQFRETAAWHMLDDGGGDGPAAAEVHAALENGDGRIVGYAGMSRPDFYSAARRAYCVVRTGDNRPYACFLVAKGVVAGTRT